MANPSTKGAAGIEASTGVDMGARSIYGDVYRSPVVSTKRRSPRCHGIRRNRDNGETSHRCRRLLARLPLRFRARVKLNLVASALQASGKACSQERPHSAIRSWHTGGCRKARRCVEVPIIRRSVGLLTRDDRSERADSDGFRSVRLSRPRSKDNERRGDDSRRGRSPHADVIPHDTTMTNGSKKLTISASRRRASDSRDSRQPSHAKPHNVLPLIVMAISHPWLLLPDNPTISGAVPFLCDPEASMEEGHAYLGGFGRPIS